MGSRVARMAIGQRSGQLTTANEIDLQRINQIIFITRETYNWGRF